MAEGHSIGHRGTAVEGHTEEEGHREAEAERQKQRGKDAKWKRAKDCQKSKEAEWKRGRGAQRQRKPGRSRHSKELFCFFQNFRVFRHLVTLSRPENKLFGLSKYFRIKWKCHAGPPRGVAISIPIEREIVNFLSARRLRRGIKIKTINSAGYVRQRG